MTVLEQTRRTRRSHRPRAANGKPRHARAPWPNGTQRLLLHNIDWQTYDTLLRALDDHPEQVGVTQSREARHEEIHQGKISSCRHGA